jgi:hypothetical protein
VVKEEGPQYTGPVLLKVGGVSPPPHRCFCSPARPEDAGKVLSGFVDTWTNIPLQQLPVRLQRKPKQKGYNPIAKGAPLLFQKASILCNLLRNGPPPDKDLGDAVASLGELAILAEEENVPLGFDLNTLTAALAPSEKWAAQASNVCRAIIDHSRHKILNHKSHNIGQKVGSRSMGFAMALEEHSSSADSMRRAKHDGSTVPTHEQTKLKGGGMSTAPADILNAHFKQFHDWFAARKAGPGGGPYEGRTDVGDLYLPSRRPEELCVAYSITFRELKAAIASAHSTSCPGPTGISVLLIKLFPDEYIETLRVQFNLMLAWGVLPKLFNKGYIFPIPKKGKMSIENSRPISLLEVHLKLLTRIINRRMVYALLDADFLRKNSLGSFLGAPALTRFTSSSGQSKTRRSLGKRYMYAWLISPRLSILCLRSPSNKRIRQRASPHGRLISSGPWTGKAPLRC